jgi:hypothetical protein
MSDIFISYTNKEPDNLLAKRFHDELQRHQHTVFMAGESIKWGETWPEKVQQALNKCDYFLVLLSEKSAKSEMVIQEIKTAKKLHDNSQTDKPRILPLRIDLSFDPQTLPYDVSSYLDRLQQVSYQQGSDLWPVLAKLYEIIGNNPISSTPSLSTAPSPFVNPSGTIPLNDPFYIERKFGHSQLTVENDCLGAIEKPSALISIRGPRQLGKSSLMARILHHARQQGNQIAFVSFQGLENSTLANLDKLLYSLCAKLEKAAHLPSKINDPQCWNNMFDVKENCTDFLEQFILARLSSPLVLAIDELDRIFTYKEVAAELLGLMRSWNEKSKFLPDWEKLKLVFSHSTESYIALSHDQSPFNVGMKVSLQNFSRDEVKILAQRYQVLSNDADPADQQNLDQLFQLVDGHPYLTQLALYHLHLGLPFAQYLAEATSDNGIYGEHLRRHLWNLKQNEDLRTAFLAVLSSQQPSDPLLNFKLNGMGLVKLHSNGQVLTSLELYNQYFPSRLKV